MKCTGCDRLATEGRKMCWHCINFKKRYGMSHDEVMAMRAKAKTMCDVCCRVRKGLQTYKSHTLCSRCWNVIVLLSDPNKFSIVSKIISGDIVVNTENDTTVQPESVQVVSNQ